MIILRNMGTLQYRKAMSPDLDSHDANTNSTQKSATSDTRKLVSATDFRALACSVGACWVDLCRADLARGWRSCAHRVSLRSRPRWNTHSSISDINTTHRKVGYPKASRIHGQSGTPHPNPDSIRNWSHSDTPKSRAASGGSPCCHGTHFSLSAAPSQNDVQYVDVHNSCLQKGVCCYA